MMLYEPSSTIFALDIDVGIDGIAMLVDRMNILCVLYMLSEKF